MSPGKYTRPLADDKRPTLRNTASRETPAQIGKRIVSRFQAVLIHNVPVIICQVWGTTDEKDSRLARRSIRSTDLGSGICTRRFGTGSNRTGSQRTGTCQEAAQATQAPRQARRCVGRRIGRRHVGQGPGKLKPPRGRVREAAAPRATPAIKKPEHLLWLFFARSPRVGVQDASRASPASSNSASRPFTPPGWPSARAFSLSTRSALSLHANGTSPCA